MLGKHVAAEGDAPFQGYSREVRTMSSLGFRPGLHGRNQSSDGRANEAQHAKISANCLDPVPVFGPLRAQMQELHDTVEILAGWNPLYAGDVLYLGRQRLFGRHRDQRPAIENEELQEDHDRHDENESGYHRGTVASREGTMRASSGMRQKAYAQVRGRRQPEMGVR